MSVSILFSVGTPLGRWATWASALLGMGSAGERLRLPAFTAWHTMLLGTDPRQTPPLSDGERVALDGLPPADADAAPWGGIDGRACWTIDALEQRFPAAQYLVFVENPAGGLGAALAAGYADDPVDWLAIWRAGARLVLRHIQRDPARCLIVDADEARQDLPAFVAACVQRFGLDLVMPETALAAEVVDPLSRALGETLAFMDGDAQALFAELQASCVRLSSIDSAPAVAGWGLQIDGAAAVRRLQELNGAHQSAAMGAKQLAALRERSEMQAPTLQQRETQLAAVDAENKAQTHLAQSLPVEASQLAQARERALLDHTQHSDELQAARRDLEWAREEGELRLLQLQQMQEELEHYVRQYRNLGQGTLATAPEAGWFDLSIVELLPAFERNAPPFRELTFTLRQIRVGAREIPEATVRLVEHHGRPGLVVFAGDQGPQLLEAWRETGREGDRPFALIVPSDAHSHPMLDAMGSTDWLLTQALVLRLEGQLRQATGPLARHWPHVARRLREQLLEMPSRFRYDTLEIDRLPDAGSDSAVFRFGQVHCGARRLKRLTVQWQAFGPQSALQLLRDADAGPPLSSWPIDERGEAVDKLLLPLGFGRRDEAKRRAWADLPAVDREFVFALLSAWPEAVSRARSTPPIANGEPAASALATAATALLEDARRAVGPPRMAPRDLLRRMARRLRQRRVITA